MMFQRIATQFARGFAMGASDVVPGVSGGTIALILGIYGDLIDNIGRGAKALGRFLRGDVSGGLSGLKAVNWMFIVPLLAGVVSAIVILAGLIETALHDYPEAMAGLFFGLVIGSIVVARSLLLIPTAVHLALALCVGIVTFVLLAAQSGPILDPSPLMLIVAGALAICAMILPGISGSFILLMIGMYAAVLGAVDDRDLADIALVGLGAIAGLSLFSSILNHALSRYHDFVMAALIGLMLGSLRVLWPWPNGVGIIDRDAEQTVSGTGLELPNGAPWVIPVLLGIAAAVAVVGVSMKVTSPDSQDSAAEPVVT